MFVTLIAMGIGNILTSLAGSVTAKQAGQRRLYTSWRVLLLLVHFSLFWNTLALLQREDWHFFDFLYVVMGPILLFFATSVLLEGPDDDEGVRLAPARFFLLMLLNQVWAFSTDFFLVGNVTRAGVTNLSAAIVFGILTARPHHKSQTVGCAVLWILGLGSLILRSLGFSN